MTTPALRAWSLGVLGALIGLCAFMPSPARGAVKGLENVSFFSSLARSDGKFIAAGITQSCASADAPCDSPSRVFVARFLNSGKLDRTFSGDGAAVLASSDDEVNVNGLIAGPDGSIVVSYRPAETPSPNGVFLTRLTSEGSLDRSFGDGDGTSLIPSSLLSTPLSQNHILGGGPAGTVLVAGSSGSGRLAVARLEGDGDLDTNYGAGGVAEVDMGPPTVSAYAGAISVEPDGAAMVAGSAKLVGPGETLALARLQPGGMPDPYFGEGGSVLFESLPGEADPIKATAAAIVRAPQGPVVAGSYVDFDSCNRFLLRSTTDSGSQSGSAFESGADSVFRAPGCSTLTDATVAGTDLIAIGGSPIGFAAIGISRLSSSGPDQPFGAPRSSLLRLAGLASTANAAEIVGHGKLVLVGSVVSDHCRGVIKECRAATIVRLKKSGAPDRRFGQGGVAGVPGFHICEKAPAERCGVDLEKEDAKKLARELIVSAGRTGKHHARLRLECSVLLERACSGTVRLLPAGKPYRYAVKAGKARHVSLPTGRGRANLRIEQRTKIARLGTFRVVRKLRLGGQKP